MSLTALIIGLALNAVAGLGVQLFPLARPDQPLGTPVLWLADATGGDPGPIDCRFEVALRG